MATPWINTRSSNMKLRSSSNEESFASLSQAMTTDQDGDNREGMAEMPEGIGIRIRSPSHDMISPTLYMLSMEDLETRGTLIEPERGLLAKLNIPLCDIPLCKFLALKRSLG